MVFERVLVGFDGSAASERALDLGLALRAPGGRIHSVTVADTHYATHAGMDAAAWDAEIRSQAQDACELAAKRLADADAADVKLMRGYAAPALLHCAERLETDLIAIGAHGHSRVAGIVLGSVATRIVHEAPCSVLVARGEGRAGGFPASIVVGTDESPASMEASAVAEAIARATGAGMRSLTGRKPVEMLVEASRSADLLVVGSRGRHGLRALGSVAERVAHEAECAVLIVRGAERFLPHTAGASALGRPVA